MGSFGRQPGRPGKPGIEQPGVLIPHERQNQIFRQTSRLATTQPHHLNTDFTGLAV